MARLVRFGRLRRVCSRFAVAAAFLMLRRAARRCLGEAIVSSLVSSRRLHFVVHCGCQRGHASRRCEPRLLAVIVRVDKAIVALQRAGLSGSSGLARRTVDANEREPENGYRDEGRADLAKMLPRRIEDRVIVAPGTQGCESCLRVLPGVRPGVEELRCSALATTTEGDPPPPGGIASRRQRRIRP